MSKRRNYDEGTHGNQLRGVLCVLVGAISWGFSGACGQFLFSHYNINTAWLSCMRMLVTGVILTIAYIIRERKAAFDIFKSTRDFFGIILFAIFGVGLCQYAYLEAIHHTNAGIATALQYLAPVMVLIISCVRRLRPPKFRNAWKYPSDEYLERGTEVGIACGVWVLHVYPASGADAKKMGQSAGRWLWHADLWRGI